MPHVKLSARNQNLELYYELHGSGKTKIIFIMGLLTEGSVWACEVREMIHKSDVFIDKIVYLE
jgi:hypothetical protein